MSKLIENYRAVNEGQMSKAEFLRQTRQQYPNYINQFTSFEDAIKIFKDKGILFEEVIYQCNGDKFPLEQIEKGIDFELEAAGVNPALLSVDPKCYRKAKETAIANLSKDPLYYVKKESAMSLKEDKQDHSKSNKVVKSVETKPVQSEVKKKVKPGMSESSYEDKRYGWNDDDHVRVQLVQAYLKKVNPETGKKYTQAEARKKADKMIKSHNKKKEGNQTLNEQVVKTIVKSVVKVLSEAATTNLAQLSDENASIQGIPAILNNLENIVTEIESFIIKEQNKIQSVFDQIGNIKNEDNIPIGYKFVNPILNSLKQDLEPVLSKINLDSIKLPDAPQLQDGEVELNTGSEEPLEDKETVFSSKGTKPQPLAERIEADHSTVCSTIQDLVSTMKKVDDRRYAVTLKPGVSFTKLNNRLDKVREPWRAYQASKDTFYVEPFERSLDESRSNRAYRYTR